MKISLLWCDACFSHQTRRKNWAIMPNMVRENFDVVLLHFFFTLFLVEVQEEEALEGEYKLWVIFVRLTWGRISGPHFATEKVGVVEGEKEK